MGDRFDRLAARHANVEVLLRRPGIGHNNGPTFDMSWEAWVWRRAAAKAWKTPKPEVAMMRLKRAERLGITYRELTSVIMDSGAHLSAAVMPLSLAARVRRGPNREIIVEPRNSIAALVAKFRGRLFVLGDIDAVPGLSDEERAGFLSLLNRAFDGKVEALGWGHDGPAIRAILKANALPHQEAFMVGAGMGHRVLAEAAGLPVALDTVEIRNGRLFHAIGLVDQPLEAHAIDFVATIDPPRERVKLQGTAIINGLPTRISIGIRTESASGPPVTVHADLPGGHLAFEGWTGHRSTDDPLHGSMSATSTSPATFIASVRPPTLHTSIRLN